MQGESHLQVVVVLPCPFRAGKRCERLFQIFNDRVRQVVDELRAIDCPCDDIAGQEPGHLFTEPVTGDMIRKRAPHHVQAVWIVFEPELRNTVRDPLRVQLRTALMPGPEFGVENAARVLLMTGAAKPRRCRLSASREARESGCEPAHSAKVNLAERQTPA